MIKWLVASLISHLELRNVFRTYRKHVTPDLSVTFILTFDLSVRSNNIKWVVVPLISHLELRNVFRTYRKHTSPDLLVTFNYGIMDLRKMPHMMIW